MTFDSPEDFEHLYSRYSQPIHRFLYWQTRNPQLAQDLTSTVFERAWRARHSFGGGSAQAWLYRIARNALIDHWRKKKELYLEDMPAVTASLEAQPDGYDFDKEQELGEMMQALNQLPDHLKTVVVLRFIEELPAAAVADILQTSEGNIRIMQLRALRKMRQWIEEQRGQ
jgi:RNA polymerase sigma-70 factor (ECF subfamily)